VGNIVTIEGACKRYGHIVALNNLCLELREAECLALVGRNGAGKTTTVRAICGLIRLDSGSIDWHPSNSPTTPNCGLVPQEIALYPLLTGIENLKVFGGLNNLRGAVLSARIDWALDWTGLSDRATEPIKRWSIGMQRRLNIACGVLHAPRIVLLDEPTANVDPESRQRIWEMLRELRDSGTSILLTTHLLSEAEIASDRIAIIDAGRVIACGALRELVRDTLGLEHRMILRLATSLREPVLDGLCSPDGKRIDATLHDILEQLPEVLRTVRRAGGEIESLEIGVPDLETVFLELTKHRVDE
jgi:ABC-2 type transport system ATP-binding protein